MSCGKLRERVTIQSVTNTQDAQGGNVATPSTVATVWAEAISAKGQEAIRAGLDRAETVVRFRMRWRTITADQQMVWRSNTYDIHEIDETQRRDGWVWVTGRAQNG